MKTAEKQKENDFAKQFEQLLRELLGRVPSLKLVSLQREAKFSPGSSERADHLAQVRAGSPPR